MDAAWRDAWGHEYAIARTLEKSLERSSVKRRAAMVRAGCMVVLNKTPPRDVVGPVYAEFGELLSEQDVKRAPSRQRRLVEDWWWQRQCSGPSEEAVVRHCVWPCTGVSPAGVAGSCGSGVEGSTGG